MVAIQPTDQPFGQALADLLREADYTTSSGNVNWHSFARELDGFTYENLRLVVAGKRPPSPAFIEEVARALKVKPDYFAEYRIHLARQQFDVREVGFEAALENLERWAHQQPGRKRRR